VQRWIAWLGLDRLTKRLGRIRRAPRSHCLPSRPACLVGPGAGEALRQGRGGQEQDAHKGQQATHKTF
jgi:hypothetical protein